MSEAGGALWRRNGVNRAAGVPSWVTMMGRLQLVEPSLLAYGAFVAVALGIDNRSLAPCAGAVAVSW